MPRSLVTLSRTLLLAGGLSLAALPGLAAAQNLPPVSLPSTKPVAAPPRHEAAKKVEHRKTAVHKKVEHKAVKAKKVRAPKARKPAVKHLP